MDYITGYYVYNHDKQAWLQDDEKSCGPIFSAVKFTEVKTATAIMERETKNDRCFVMTEIV